MKKRFNDVQIIGVGLSILYAVSFSIYYQYLRSPDTDVRVIILGILFGILFVGSVAIMLLKEWGRNLVVFTNGVLAIYLLVPYVNIKDLIPLSYVFMSVIIFLFFNQPKIKVSFMHKMLADKSKGEWRSILVIDDDELIIKTVRPILMSAGYSVLTANSGEDGLQIAKNQKPDLVLLDVILPGIKGREVCKRIKADPVTRNIPVVFLTSKDSPDDIQAEMQAGAIAHLTKPVNPKSLVATLKDILN